MIKLNVGSGPTPAPGWIHIETNQDHIRALFNAGISAAEIERVDFTSHLPWDDDSVDLLVSHHALQMVPYVKLRSTLAEWYRIVKPGGRIRISVPNTLAAFNAWLSADAGWFPIVDEAETSLDGKLCAYLTWYSEARTVFTFGWLQEL